MLLRLRVEIDDEMCDELSDAELSSRSDLHTELAHITDEGVLM